MGLKVGHHVSTHYYLSGKKGGCSNQMSPTALPGTVTRVENGFVSVHFDEFDSEQSIPSSWVQALKDFNPGWLPSLKVGYGIKSYYRSAEKLITDAIGGVIIEMRGALVHVQFDRNSNKQWVPAGWVREVISKSIDKLNVGRHVSTHYYLAGKRGGCSNKMSPTALDATVTGVESGFVGVLFDSHRTKQTVPGSWISKLI